MKRIEEMTLKEIQDLAVKDGFGVLGERELFLIRKAAEEGRLLWVKGKHIVAVSNELNRQVTILPDRLN